MKNEKYISIQMDDTILEFIFPTNKSRWIKNILLENIDKIENLIPSMLQFNSELYNRLVKKAHEIKKINNKTTIKLLLNVNSEKEKKLYILLKSLGSPYVRGAVLHEIIFSFIDNNTENKEKIRKQMEIQKKDIEENKIENIGNDSEPLDNLKIF